jgi:hypothetical protein
MPAAETKRRLRLVGTCSASLQPIELSDEVEVLARRQVLVEAEALGHIAAISRDEFKRLTEGSRERFPHYPALYANIRT